jgi:hypothetical protein
MAATHTSCAASIEEVRLVHSFKRIGLRLMFSVRPLAQKSEHSNETWRCPGGRAILSRWGSDLWLTRSQVAGLTGKDLTSSENMW